MIRRPPTSTGTYPRFPDTPPFLSGLVLAARISPRRTVRGPVRRSSLGGAVGARAGKVFADPFPPVRDRDRHEPALLAPPDAVVQGRRTARRRDGCALYPRRYGAG